MSKPAQKHSVRYTGECRGCGKYIQSTPSEEQVGLGNHYIHLACSECGTTNWVSRKSQ